MATISKTLRLFEAPKFSQRFSPLRSFGFCLQPGLGPRLPRRNTSALGIWRRPRFRGRGAPRGEGGRGRREQQGPWPRRRILGGKPVEAWDRCEVEEDVTVNGSSVSWVLFSLLMESVPVCQNILTNMLCWSL